MRTRRVQQLEESIAQYMTELDLADRDSSLAVAWVSSATTYKRP